MYRPRIGLVGFGHIGAELYRHLIANPTQAEVAFVYARTEEAVKNVPRQAVAVSLEEIASYRASLIVEAAHPEISARHGVSFLRVSDYMPLSVSALADEDLLAQLVATARSHGTRLLVPHGALVGLDSLLEWQRHWEEVTITFRKPPASLDAGVIAVETVLYDGPVRGAAKLFPRNVNAMVTCAMATVGLDRCRARIIADPTVSTLSLLVEARGVDGAHLKIERQQPAVGVSGTEMFASLLRSVSLAIGRQNPLEFV